MTAAQMVVAEALGLRVKSVVVGYSKLAGVVCPIDMRLAVNPTPLEALLIAYGATLGLAVSGACTVAQAMADISPEGEAAMSKAGAFMAAYGGKQFAELVDVLEMMRENGERVIWHGE